MPSEQLELCVKQVQALNEKASIITTPWDELSGEAVLKVMEQQDSMEMQLLAEARHKKDAAEHEHHHHGDGEDSHEGHGHHHGEEGHHHHDHKEGHHHDHGEEHPHDHEEHHHHGHEEGHHHHHHADEIFTSWGKETPHKYDRAVIENALKVLCDTEDYGDILRAKGMVESTDGSWIYFDMTPGEYELRSGEPEYTGRLCVIGCNLAEDKLLQLFEIA